MLFFSKGFPLSAGFLPSNPFTRPIYLFRSHKHLSADKQTFFLQKTISGSFAITEFPFKTLQNDCSRLFRHARPVSRHRPLNCYYFYQTSHSSLSCPKYQKQLTKQLESTRLLLAQYRVSCRIL